MTKKMYKYYDPVAKWRKKNLRSRMPAEKGAARLDEPATSLASTTTDAADDDVDADAEPALGGYMNLLFGNRGTKANATSEEESGVHGDSVEELTWSAVSFAPVRQASCVRVYHWGARVKKISGGGRSCAYSS